MNNAIKISTQISAGKKDFDVVPENDGYTLFESGSIVAVLKCKENGWEFTQGSYNENDARILGDLIKNQE